MYYNIFMEELGINKNFKDYWKICNQIKSLQEESLDYVINRFLKNNKNIEKKEIKEIRIEFLRFFSLLLVDPDIFISPPPLVDQFWHEFILFTLDYYKFCLKHNNGLFFHHIPAKNNTVVKEMDSVYQNTRDLIIEMYPSYNKKNMGKI